DRARMVRTRSMGLRERTLTKTCVPHPKAEKGHVICNCRMSAIGPKRTFHYVAFDVAFGGKADMTLCAARVELSNGLAPSSQFRSWLDCIINTSGCNFRKGQDRIRTR